jgi:hypothetical protein
MTIYHSVTELIGRTPLIQLHKLIPALLAVSEAGKPKPRRLD